MTAARRWIVLTCLGVVSLVLAGCGRDQEPPPMLSWGGEGDGSVSSDGSRLLDAGWRDGPPSPDAQGYCGNQFFQVDQVPVNLYFVLDRSGSMADDVPELGVDKLTAVRKACVEMVKQIGSRAKIGAAVFPGYPRNDACGAGRQVFKTTRGDDPAETDGGLGPVTLKFATSTNVEPLGGTSISATLQKLEPILTSLDGETVVILATDGGPNCNAQMACDADGCMWNIEHRSVEGHECTPSYNCCDPSIDQGPGYRGCLDSNATVDELARLAEQGIRTYVIGIPGSQTYSKLLGDMADAGGTARSGQQERYYRVDDISDLTSVLEQIGNNEVVTCRFDLSSAPPDPGLVNVYVDGHVLPMDSQDGWTWLDQDTLIFHGNACSRLKSGQIEQVQVVAGCPTEKTR